MNFSISELSKKIGVSRRHVYNIFDNPNVPIDMILKIGKVIHYDFSNDIKEISIISNDIKNSSLNSNELFYNDASFWRKKYVDLLEEYQLLLKNKLKELLDDHK